MLKSSSDSLSLPFRPVLRALAALSASDDHGLSRKVQAPCDCSCPDGRALACDRGGRCCGSGSGRESRRSRALRFWAVSCAAASFALSRRRVASKCSSPFTKIRIRTHCSETGNRHNMAMQTYSVTARKEEPVAFRGTIFSIFKGNRDGSL